MIKKAIRDKRDPTKSGQHLSNYRGGKYILFRFKVSSSERQILVRRGYGKIDM